MYYHLTSNYVDIEVVAFDGRVTSVSEKLEWAKDGPIQAVMSWAREKKVKVIVRERAGSRFYYTINLTRFMHEDENDKVAAPGSNRS